MRREIATVAGVLAAAVSLVGPAQAEWSALQQLRAGMARCSDGSATCGGVARADVDLEGLRLWHPWAQRSGLHVEADRLAIGLGLDGITIDAHELRLSRPSPPVTRPDAPATSQAAAEPTAPLAPRRSPLDTHGIPVHLRVHGPTALTLAGITLDLDAPELHLDGHGQASARFGVSASGHGIRARGLDRWEAETIDGDPRRWQATGPLSLAEGPPSIAAVVISPDGIEARLHDGTGGHLQLRAPVPEAGTRPAWLSLRAEAFSLRALGHTGARSLSAWGIDPTAAELDAELTLTAEGATRSLAVDHLTLRGLVVDSPKLARDPVHLEDLRLRGEAEARGDDELVADLWIAHREAELGLSVQLGPDAWDVHTALAPLPCQALVHALPDAMTEMLSGTELRGEIEARADLHVDRLALAQARALPHRPTDAPPPGELSLWFPFLERCTVVRDDPRLDLAALTGPYRHRFVDADGNHRTRLLAREAPGYVSIAEVPRLARAFVTLEDRRFWNHDGFDREQIVNAFWHNLVQGRVSRGASTISQQAARNLWLGVDRSWGRKLQEALLTARLEASTPKPRIMELYLNVIELGPGTHGVQDAAMLYFGKPASELSVLQSIHLAALAPAPNRYAKSFEDGRVTPQWREMLDEHVRRMYRAGLINRAEMIAALGEDLGLLDRSR
ncbi:MAG: transglycosylase domain-containing protein [Myxococcales bacterium]|nr:transglycosylase domain-containing protein [Myxococcales bacterium]